MASALAQLASSALMTTLPLRIAGVGGSASEAGFIAAAYSLGFMAGCMRGVRMINRIGHIRAFAGAAGLTALLLLLFKNTESIILWSALRFFMGAAFAVLFATSDAWLNETIKDEVRGRVLSANSILIGAMAILSQIFVAQFSEVPLQMMELLSAVLLAAVVMLCMTHSVPPRTYKSKRIKLKDIWAQSPVAVLGSFCSGAIVTSLLTIVPFSLSKAGVGGSTTALMIAMLYIGRLLFQWPIGSLSDRIDRRWIILGSSLLITTIMLTFLVADPFAGWNSGFLKNYQLLAILGVVLLFLGGLSFPLQSICVAHAFERKPESSVALSTYLLFIWAVGSVSGPTAISVISPLLGSKTPDILLSTLSGSLALFTAYRLYVSKLQFVRRASPRRSVMMSALAYAGYRRIAPPKEG
ncbi:MFS transporter [Pseudovibrio sp. Tun.PSC04-5.I4]|uniref:MFS transporter n=1 Tax=Pseudovibrio sp. Tun.PSC04-5.I4 TaxID=1798213 RepID=UPI001AD8DD30|nr:MFS transporter [Pseudovibrio sp. Tun.PSC04-5.I4]